MTNLPIIHSNRVERRNRKYWKLQDMIPKDERIPYPVNFEFLIKRIAYSYKSGFVDLAHYCKYRVFRFSEWLEISVTDHSMTDNEVLDLRVGIVRKSGKEIVASNTQITFPGGTAVIRVIQRSEFDKIMQTYRDLEFFVVVDAKLKEEKKKEEEHKLYMQKFRSDYKELLISGRNSDFTINVKSMKFQVHSSILGARSPVFSAMMAHEMKEKQSGEVSIIDADPAVFQDFLLYLYSGDEEHLNWNNIAELYELGDKYCVEDFKYLCVERMKTHISIENFFQIFYISQRLNNFELSEFVIQFFVEDSKEIVESETCKGFMKDHPEEACVLMKALAANKYC